MGYKIKYDWLNIELEKINQLYYCEAECFEDRTLILQNKEEIYRCILKLQLARVLENFIIIIIRETERKRKRKTKS